MKEFRPFAEKTMGEKLANTLKVMLVASLMIEIGYILLGALGIIK